MKLCDVHSWVIDNGQRVCCSFSIRRSRSMHFQSNRVTIANDLFKFLYATELNVRDTQKSDDDDSQSQDVLPEICFGLVCNTLLFQMLRSIETIKNIFLLMKHVTINIQVWTGLTVQLRSSSIHAVHCTHRPNNSIRKHVINKFLYKGTKESNTKRNR